MKYLLIIPMLICGCSSDQKESNIRARQDAAMNDPMNYSPNAADRTDISGGGVTDLKKVSLKKDLNSVFNP